MGFRFQKRIRIFKGLTLNLNLSKSGTSWTVGGPGASVNLKDGKATGTVGIPGTGLSYRERLDNAGSGGSGRGGGLGWVVWLVVAIVLLGVLFGR
jgi:hypothetical protein